MPSIVTHHYFARDVLNTLPKNIQKNIEYSQYFYDIFAQSFDNLFYYKFFTPWKGKEIRNLGTLAQRTKVNEYFENIIDYITKNKLKDNKEILAYLYGSICHYVLDSYCHPFIIYQAGYVLNNLKYRGNHEKIETTIDAYIYKSKENKELKNAKLANKLLPRVCFDNTLKDALTYTFLTTFSKANMGSIYEQSLHTGNFLLKYFVTDRTGIKKIIYTLKDFLSYTSHRKYSNLSFHITKINNDYLNINKETWYHPVNKKPSNLSFIELYERATKEASKKIKAIDTYLNTSKISKQELLKIIGNLSYTTGLDCNQKQTLKYFKY